MFIEVIHRMDPAILELAISDGFRDACVYEGDEFVEIVREYLKIVNEGQNTFEQDIAFYEATIPYVKESIMRYDSLLFEGLSVGGPDDPANTTKEGFVGADVSGVVSKEDKDKYLKKAGLDVPVKAKTTLTEAEELEAIKTFGKKFFDVAKSGAEKIWQAGKTVGRGVVAGVKAGSKAFKDSTTPVSPPSSGTTET